MTTTPRLVLLARAWRTPLGDDVDAVVTRLLAGDRAAVVDPATGRLIAPLASTPTSRRSARVLGPLAALGLDVGRDVVTAAGLAGPGPGPGPGPDGDRIGLYLATGGLRASWDEVMPAMVGQRADGDGAWARGLGRLHPLWMLRYLSNGAHGQLAAELGLRGDGAAFAGPAAVASALSSAADALAAGVIDAAVVVAVDDLLAAEVRVELAVRDPDVVPGAAAAAIVVTAAGPAGTPGAITLHAVDSVALRARLAPAPVVGFAAATGDLGAAGLLVDVIAAATCLERRAWPPGLNAAASAAVTCLIAAAPGALGAIRVAYREAAP